MGDLMMYQSKIDYAAYIHDQIIKLVPELVAQECSILDFGCGDGFLTNFMQNTFFKAHVVGIDSNKSLVEKAAIEFPTITFQHVQDKKLPFADNSFDLIYAVDVFHHLHTSDHVFYVSELMRVLKHGGRFILFEVNPYNLFAYIQFKKNPLEKNSMLLMPTYASQLFSSYTCSSIVKYYFLSQLLPLRLKEYMWHLPFGSVYSVLVHKK